MISNGCMYSIGMLYINSNTIPLLIIVSYTCLLEDSASHKNQHFSHNLCNLSSIYIRITLARYSCIIQW